ncbi:MAG: NAD(P)-dependent oxidoreductase [Acidobacteriota bacterium]|nr:NAD(P)-dependent oxidoreductase [Acidobacteriota bacterium]
MFVTGGRGFLGRSLLTCLNGRDVLCLSRDGGVVPAGARVVDGDLATPGPWQQAVVDFAPDWCMHLAWDGLPDYSLARCRANLDANVALMETLVRARVKRVVVAGTCWEYGRVTGPQREDAAPVEPGLFASTKHSIRTLLDGVAREAGFDYRWARVFFAYGPGQRGGSLIPHLRASLAAGQTPSLREPHAVQDFIHVDDVARGLVALAECDAPSGVFNLGSGEPTSVGEIANRVATHYGRPPVSGAGARAGGFWADLTRTRRLAGWEPRIGLAEGIRTTLQAMDVAA